MPDIRLRNEGTLFLITGVSKLGCAWLDEHLDPEALRWFGSFVVEPRYVSDIVEGLIRDGLVVR